MDLFQFLVLMFVGYFCFWLVYQVVKHDIQEYFEYKNICSFIRTTQDVKCRHQNERGI